MPITSTFVADFSSFQDAVENAQTKLITFQDSSTKVANSLSAMERSISGVPIVQAATVAAEAVDRLGGVTKLTDAELQRLGTTAQQAVDKLQALGQNVPPGIQHIADAAAAATEETGALGGAADLASGMMERLIGAFAIEKVVEFAKGALDAAAQLEDLSLATGISTEGLQKLQYVGVEFGVGLDQLARGVEQLNAKLAQGQIDQEVKDLGLNVAALKAAGPEEAFLEIAEAVGRIEDPMQKAAMASELFGGRIAKVLLPALGDLRTMMADVPPLMDEATVKMAHDFDVGISQMELRAKSFVAGLAEVWFGPGGVIEILTNTKRVTVDAKDGFDVLADGAETAGTKIVVQTKAEREAALKFAEAMVQLTSAGDGWKGTLDTMSGVVVEGIKYYLAAGVSQKDLAIAYGVTETQVKAVAAALKDEAEQHKAVQKAQADADAQRMASYATSIKLMTDQETQAQKTVGGYQAQIDALQALDSAELVLTQSVYANITSEKDRMKLIEDSGKQHQAIVDKELALDAIRKEQVNTAVLAELDAQTKLNAAYGETATGGIAMQQTAYTTLMTKLDQLHTKKVDGIAQTNEENVLYKDYTDALLKAAQADDAAALAAATHGDQLDRLRAKTNQAKAATDAYTYSMQSQFSILQGQDAAAKAAAMGGQVATDSYGNKYVYVPGVNQPGVNPMPAYVNVPHFASGVQNFGGGMALVGEHGPELVNLPSGSDVLPYGTKGGGVVQNVVIHVNGTAVDVAKQISDILMRTAMQGQQFAGA